VNPEREAESGWLIADPGEFTSEWNLILRVSQEFGTSLSLQNFMKPIKLGGEVDYNATADTEKSKGAIR
jgi:hypothetical protein